MSATMLLTAALISQSAKPLSFQEFEKRKYETFASLRSFRGRYKIITAKSDGTAMRQDLVYQFGPKGRQMLLLINNKPFAELGWNETQVWRVSYNDKTLQSGKVEVPLNLKPFEKLKSTAGQMNFVAGEFGIRFGFDPEPTVTGPDLEVTGDFKEDRYSITIKDDAQDSVANIRQWCDQGTFLIRRFEILVTVKGTRQLLVRGELLEDDQRAVIPPTVGQVPTELPRDFKRVGDQ